MSILHKIMLYGVFDQIIEYVYDLESPPAPNTWKKVGNGVIRILIFESAYLILFSSIYKCRESYRFFILTSDLNITTIGVAFIFILLLCYYTQDAKFKNYKYIFPIKT